MDHDLSAFRPHADGHRLDTAAIQEGIEAVHRDGGGALRIGAGRYLVGGILLRSGVTLLLSEGAVLIASPRYEDFLAHEAATEVEGARHAVIYARDARDVGVRGPGRIVGNADAYFEEEADEQGYRRPLRRRPRVLLFEGCENVTIEDVVIERAPIWTVHLVACRDASIARVTIDNDLRMANTDGIDIDGCQRVRVADCRISSADDGVCIKTTRRPDGLSGPAEHIVVTGCIIRSTSCAVKVGTETVEDVRFVVVSGCTFSANRGVGLISRDGGALRHIVVSDITLECALAGWAYWGKSEPIFVSAGHRDPGQAPGAIEHVRFSSISGDTEGAITLHADDGALISDVALDGIRIVQRESASPLQGMRDLRPVPSSETGPKAAPGGGTTGVAPYPAGLPGVHAHGIRGLRIDDVVVHRPDPLPVGWNPRTIVETR
jgi:hypothetical protein